MTRIVFLLVCVAGCVYGQHSFQYQNCMPRGRSDPNNVFHVNDARITPFPVIVPGPMMVYANIDILRNFSAPLELSVTVQRKLLGIWMTVPCIDNVGSCVYELCSLLNSEFLVNCQPPGSQQNCRTECPAPLTDAHVPCTCPFRQGNYVMPNALFQIPELSGIWSWLASADFRGAGIIRDTTRGRRVLKGCLYMEVSLRLTPEPCTSFLCSLFG